MERAGVSIFLPDLRFGGAERVCVNLANEFARRGIAVDLVLMQRQGGLLPRVDPAVYVTDLGSPRVRQCVQPLAAYLGARKPDVLLANMWPLPVAALLARTLGKSRTRIVGVSHTTWSSSELFGNPWKRAQIQLSMRALYRWLDAMVAVSKGAAEDLSRISGLARERITTIYNPVAGVGGGSQGELSLPSLWKAGPHDKILAVGTLTASKDFPALLHSFARLRKTRDARLLILGEGNERTALENLVGALGLEGVVSMPGFSADTSAFYAAADLLVVSSKCEGFGNVIVEALEQGTPVVSTDCPSGPREILQEVGSSRVDLQACKLEYSIVSPK